MMAALASAAMPNATIAGGKLYDVFASNTVAGRKRLAGRVRAAQTLMGNRELG